MNLEKKDVDLFYKLYMPLLIYANKKENISKNNETDIEKVGKEDFLKIRDYIYDHSEIIDSFVKENPKNFSDEELEIIKGWKNFIRDDLYVMEYTEEYTIFFDEKDKIYGVLGLYAPLKNVIVSPIPCLVKAILLPFKGHITYDGILFPYPVTFGRTMKRDLIDDYNETKAKFGVITSLPFSPKEKKENEENLLKFYLKSEKNREYYYEEIEKLKSKNKNLLTLYYQEMGRHNAIKYKRKINDYIKPNTTMWFAIIDDVIIASGKTEDEVEQNLNAIISSEKRNFVYIFKVTGRK